MNAFKNNSVTHASALPHAIFFITHWARINALYNQHIKALSDLQLDDIISVYAIYNKPAFSCLQWGCTTNREPEWNRAPSPHTGPVHDNLRKNQATSSIASTLQGIRRKQNLDMKSLIKYLPSQIAGGSEDKYWKQKWEHLYFSWGQEASANGAQPESLTWLILWQL